MPLVGKWISRLTVDMPSKCGKYEDGCGNKIRDNKNRHVLKQLLRRNGSLHYVTKFSVRVCTTSALTALPIVFQFWCTMLHNTDIYSTCSTPESCGA